MILTSSHIVQYCIYIDKDFNCGHMTDHMTDWSHCEFVSNGLIFCCNFLTRIKNVPKIGANLKSKLAIISAYSVLFSDEFVW